MKIEKVRPHGVVFCVFVFPFFLKKKKKNHALSRKGQDLKERNSGEMTGNCCDPPPLRKPSHHVVRPYRSPRKSERVCGLEKERESERVREEYSFPKVAGVILLCSVKG